MSLLISEGHVIAEHYVLAKVWEEAKIVRKRIADRIATEAVMMQLVGASIMTGKTQPLNKQLKRLRNG